MPIRSVTLTDHFDQFIDAGISSGRFPNADEIVREGLRLLEERQEEDQAKLEWLRAAAKDAFDSLDRGEGITFKSMDELAAYIDKVGEEVATEIAAEQQT